MIAKSLINRISGYGLGNYFGGNTAYRLLERFTPAGRTVIEYEDSPLVIQAARSPCERSLYWRGEYEEHVRKAIHGHLSPGDVAIDVGAHVGHHTVSMRKAVGPYGTVLAIEPHPERYDTLCENTKKYDNVIPVRYAVSDQTDTHGLLSGDIPALSDGGDTVGESVPVTTLNRLIDEYRLGHVQLVKIDVEGHEVRVLRGLDTSNVGAVIVECHGKDSRTHRVKEYTDSISKTVQDDQNE